MSLHWQSWSASSECQEARQVVHTHACLAKKIKLNENTPGGRFSVFAFVCRPPGSKQNAKVQFLLMSGDPMKQRGRKSRRSLETINVDGSPDRVQPPDHLSADEQRRFTEIVSTCDARHFRPSDTTLLVRFVEADALAERAAKELRKHPVVDGKPSPWLAVQEKSVRALVALSMRLRLSPQTRIDAKAWADRNAPNGETRGNVEK